MRSHTWRSPTTAGRLARLSVATGAAALIAGGGGVVLAAGGTSPQGQIQTFDAFQRPASPGKGRGGRAGARVRLLATLRRADGRPPASQISFRVDFPTGMVVNSRRFPKCDRLRLQIEGIGVCPRRSRVGSGALRAVVRPTFEAQAGAEVGARVELYNGTGRTLILWADPPRPSSPLAIVGQIRDPEAAGFGPSASFRLPNVIGLVPNAAITRLDARLGATLRRPRRRGGRARARRIHYLLNPVRCRRGAFRWRLRSAYDNGENLRVEDAVPCGRR